MQIRGAEEKYALPTAEYLGDRILPSSVAGADQCALAPTHADQPISQRKLSKELPRQKLVFLARTKRTIIARDKDGNAVAA